MISWGSFLLGGIVFGFGFYLMGVIHGSFYAQVKHYKEILEYEETETDFDSDSKSEELEEFHTQGFYDVDNDIDTEQNWRCQ